MENLKRGEEDYLRVIYDLECPHKPGVKAVDISKRLGISKSSVSEMLRKLNSKNLIKIQPYSKIFLTRQGRKKAENQYTKHRVITKFMKKFLNHDEDMAIKESHKLEHAFSEDSIQILKEIIGGKRKYGEMPGYVG
ncbi:MAG: metal-dependent transcriptional regulator [Nanoarchaeota archaeon]|nr:metal-dependent transcriptional regulator [Nanoarchaeota archaeon]